MSNIPVDLKYTKTHEWIKEGSNRLGITHHAQELLGDLVFVELPEVGQSFQAGDEIGVVESVKAASDFYAPISGTVLAINQQVVEDPSLINRDPYGEGWLVEFKANETGENQSLLSHDQYETAIMAEDH